MLDIEFRISPYYYITTEAGPQPRRPDYFVIELNGELESPALYNNELSAAQESLDEYLHVRGIAKNNLKAISEDPLGVLFHKRYSDLAQAVLEEEMSKPEFAALVEGYICKKYNLESFNIKDLKFKLTTEDRQTPTNRLLSFGILTGLTICFLIYRYY